MNFSMTQILHENCSIMEMRPVADLDLIKKLDDLSRAAYSAVKAESYVRIDIRRDARTGLLYLLEVNACPSIGLESTIEEILRLNDDPFERFFNDLLQFGTNTSSKEKLWDDQGFYNSDHVILTRDPVKGGCVKTKKNIKRGVVLFSADIEAFGAEEFYKKNYCNHCLKIFGTAL